MLLVYLTSVDCDVRVRQEKNVLSSKASVPACILTPVIHDMRNNVFPQAK